MESVTQSYSYKIEMVQHIADRWTLNRYSCYDSVPEIQSQLGSWLEITARLCMSYKIMNGLVAVPLTTYFQRITTRTRHSQSHPSHYVRSIPHLICINFHSFPWLSGNGIDPRCAPAYTESAQSGSLIS